MSEDQYADRKKLTFEQAEGAAPLPQQLQLKEVSHELRALLWAIVYASLKSGSAHPSMGGPQYFTSEWQEILYDKHILRDHLMADDFHNECKKLIPGLKRIFTDGDYANVFGFIQFVLRHPKRPFKFDREIAWALIRGRAAYRLMDGNTIVPVASAEEGRAVERAFADVGSAEFHGARTHLRKAAMELTAGNFAPSIRESIHAVESVARVLDPTSQTLGPALAKLEKGGYLHGALKAGFSSLYGFTSDEKGVRHALIEDPTAKVDETDALYMLGACASFVSYMINKAKAGGVIK